VQCPHQKINRALVLGGAQGIGKDTVLAPVQTAVGPWNFVEVSPSQILGRFNGFAKAVILRVSEARDLGDVDRFAFYDSMKKYEAAPPEALRVDEKNLREYAALNVCGVVITSNDKDSLYLPRDDRRHFVTWSPRTRDEERFAGSYWSDLYAWFASGGAAHAAAYLRAFDLTHFNPAAPPPHTAAFWMAVDAHRPPEDAELADAVDRLGNPRALTLTQIGQRPGDAGVL
jgi:hypothetical protein